MGPGREHTLEEGTVPLKTSLGVHLHYSLSKTTSVSAGAGGGLLTGVGGLHDNLNHTGVFMLSKHQMSHQMTGLE